MSGWAVLFGLALCLGSTPATAATESADDLPAAASSGFRSYLASIGEAALTDADGFEVGSCPLLGADAFTQLAALGGSSVEYRVAPAVIMPLTIARLGDPVSVQCSFSGGAAPGVLAAEIIVLDLGVSVEIERQLDQVMRGSAWEPIVVPWRGDVAGRCLGGRDRDDCQLAWKSDDMAVLVTLSFSLGSGDAAQARLVFGGLVDVVLRHLATLG